MVRIIPKENTERRYEDLAKAIIIQAADDYKRYRFVLDTIDIRRYKSYEGRARAIENAKNQVKKVEVFFHTPWFYELSNLNGDFALAALKKTYEEEYFPVRLEELMDDSKIGRFRFRYEGD